MHRRHAFTAIALLGALCGLAPAPRAQTEAAGPDPLLLRIKMATVATPDINKVRDLYATWLGYKVRETAKVTKPYADSWGAPKMVGHTFVMMSSDGSPDVFLRLVQTDAPSDYKPMTTPGWNSFEIIVDDVDALYAKLQKSPFKIIGEPHPLFSTSSIHAMQVLGPAKEVLYLTMQTGPKTDRRLPEPNAFVGRPFILVLGGDMPKIRDWYADTFHLPKNKINDTPVHVLRDAQNLPEGTWPLTTGPLRQKGNSIEFDGYPTANTKARPRVDGQLPPGNAMATFTVPSLDGLNVKFISPPQKMYGTRAATFIGPAGELTELIEDPSP